VANTEDRSLSPFESATLRSLTPAASQAFRRPSPT